MDRAEEARLLARARNGDSRAFGQLVDAHQSAVRGFVRRLAGAGADAEDIAQEAFARTWEMLHRFDGAATLRSFVCGVAYNYWRRAFRARTRRTKHETAFAADADTTIQQQANAGARLALRRAMNDLPEDQRAALALCLGAEFTHAEAAAALGLPLGTVKSHVLRGRDRLRQALGVNEESAS